jgi:hypothetical protein
MPPYIYYLFISIYTFITWSPCFAAVAQPDFETESLKLEAVQDNPNVEMVSDGGNHFIRILQNHSLQMNLLNKERKDFSANKITVTIFLDEGNTQIGSLKITEKNKLSLKSGKNTLETNFPLDYSIKIPDNFTITNGQDPAKIFEQVPRDSFSSDQNSLVRLTAQMLKPAKCYFFDGSTVKQLPNKNSDQYTMVQYQISIDVNKLLGFFLKKPMIKGTLLMYCPDKPLKSNFVMSRF